MKLKTKISIDKFIGLPLVYGLNALARILGFFLRINHSLDKPIKTIAVCKFVGLGSIIQATPLLQTLRKNYPKAHIIFITNSSNKELLQHINEVDEIFTITDKGFSVLLKSSINTLFRLWKNKPDVYIDLEIYSNFSSVIATMSLSKNRLGFFKNDKMYRKGMYTHMMFFNVKSPVSQTYMQFARLLGAKNCISELRLNSFNEEEKNIYTESIKRKLAVNNLEKYIVVNPNASDLRLERRWNIENMIELINKIGNELNEYKVILVGDKGETSYVNKIYAALNSKANVLDSSGKLTITELIVLISNSNLMITNDTGPMHIAFALKTKTVALFGPCSPQQYGGIENTFTIYKNVYCSPCVHEFIIPPCNGDNQCMKKISVEEVFNAARLTLSKSYEIQSGETIPQSIDYISSDSTKPLGVVLR